MTDSTSTPPVQTAPSPGPAAVVPNSRNAGKGKKTPLVVATICGMIERGVPITHAARIAGISNQTLCVWRRDDGEFRTAIELAKSNGIQSRLKKIEDAAAAGDWRAAAWLLEHCNPEEFSKHRVEVHQTGSVEHVHTIPAEVLAEIILAREARESRERLATEATPLLSS